MHKTAYVPVFLIQSVQYFQRVLPPFRIQQCLSRGFLKNLPRFTPPRPDNRVWFHVAAYHAAALNHCAVPHGHALINCHIISYPDIISDDHRIFFLQWNLIFILPPIYARIPIVLSFSQHHAVGKIGVFPAGAASYAAIISDCGISSDSQCPPYVAPSPYHAECPDFSGFQYGLVADETGSFHCHLAHPSPMPYGTAALQSQQPDRIPFETILFRYYHCVPSYSFSLSSKSFSFSIY